MDKIKTNCNLAEENKFKLKIINKILNVNLFSSASFIFCLLTHCDMLLYWIAPQYNVLLYHIVPQYNVLLYCSVPQYNVLLYCIVPQYCTIQRSFVEAMIKQ